MVFVNRTIEFKELCLHYPEAKRQKTSSGRKDDETTPEQAAAKAYLSEGYTILKHVSTLNTLLQSARRPYLNVDAHPTYTRTRRDFDLSAAAAGKPDAFAGVKYLTDDERDQIDTQARMILRKCADRVKDMETLEQRRQEALAARTNPLARLLPTRLLGSDSTADIVAAHRSNIAWYLTRRLADTSQAQKEMQEERIRRQTERAKTLGSSAAMYEVKSLNGSARQPSLGLESWSMGSSATSGLAALTGWGSRGPDPLSPLQRPPVEDDESDEEPLELTPAQILQFEHENAAILRSVEDTLASIQQAESRLLDISSLQTELIVQLAKQTEIVENLYDEAITTQAEVEKGHVQLKQARERARESRKWLLIFIIGATAAMLFLHWYD
ncbi:hypothetical protein FRB99_002072 [Tulasnella sp. 403]|nr:hypothetical protein FRB99_002072 [Tulasnella sp. 403]